MSDIASLADKLASQHAPHLRRQWLTPKTSKNAGDETPQVAQHPFAAAGSAFANQASDAITKTTDEAANRAGQKFFKDVVPNFWSGMPQSARDAVVGAGIGVVGGGLLGGMSDGVSGALTGAAIGGVGGALGGGGYRKLERQAKSLTNFRNPGVEADTVVDGTLEGKDSVAIEKTAEGFVDSLRQAVDWKSLNPANWSQDSQITAGAAGLGSLLGGFAGSRGGGTGVLGGALAGATVGGGLGLGYRGVRGFADASGLGSSAAGAGAARAAEAGVVSAGDTPYWKRVLPYPFGSGSFTTALGVTGAGWRAPATLADTWASLRNNAPQVTRWANPVFNRWGALNPNLSYWRRATAGGPLGLLRSNIDFGNLAAVTNTRNWNDAYGAATAQRLRNAYREWGNTWVDRINQLERESIGNQPINAAGAGANTRVASRLRAFRDTLANDPVAAASQIQRILKEPDQNLTTLERLLVRDLELTPNEYARQTAGNPQANLVRPSRLSRLSGILRRGVSGAGAGFAIDAGLQGYRHSKAKQQQNERALARQLSAAISTSGGGG